jgi:hypothetical protein
MKAAMASTRDQAEPESARLVVPDQATLLAELAELTSNVDPIARCLEAARTGVFAHPDGRTDRMEGVVLMDRPAALIAHLARRCPVPLSIEIGFGMGSSASMILGTRAFCGHLFQHYAFDPFGLPDNRGAVVESYLNGLFEGRFFRIRERAEIGLGALLKSHGRQSAGLIYIDGNHHFEHVMADFLLADLLCCEGGFVIFDDAWFPAIETVINYIAANRPDYAVHHLPAENMSFIQKLGRDRRAWSSFKPFPVPAREDWTAADR